MLGQARAQMESGGVGEAAVGVVKVGLLDLKVKCKR